MSKQDLLRNLPSVSELLSAEEELCVTFGQGLSTFAFRQILDKHRKLILAGNEPCGTIGDAARDLMVRLTRPEGRQAINGTGILLHTGLGRAPLSEAAVKSLSVSSGYSVLQTSLDTGERCLREEKIEAMLQDLTGCEAATVVNNNAAATMLVLNTLAKGKEVIISRGQLIEIGGAFRMTDVMGMSDATLVEVGCTNRTHLRDYENAITEKTGALIHVHTSNYRVRGFSSTPDIQALAGLGKTHGLPVIDDLGSGALVNLSEWGLPDEPLVNDSMKAGSAVACFSGDKLICGPQCGIIVGKKEWIATLRKNPFARMFRVCKMTLAVLETTLTHFLNNTFREALPLYQMLERSMDSLAVQAEKVVAGVNGMPGVSIHDDLAFVGSGSIPDEGIPTVVVRIESDSATGLARRLRKSTPSVFGRIKEDALLLDMRTIHPNEVDALVAALQPLGDE